MRAASEQAAHEKGAQDPPVESAGPGATAIKVTPRKTAARRPTSCRTAAGQSASRAAGASDIGTSAERSADSRTAAAGEGRIERMTECSAQVLEEVTISSAVRA